MARIVESIETPLCWPNFLPRLALLILPTYTDTSYVKEATVPYPFGRELMLPHRHEVQPVRCMAGVRLSFLRTPHGT